MALPFHLMALEYRLCELLGDRLIWLIVEDEPSCCFCRNSSIAIIELSHTSSVMGSSSRETSGAGSQIAKIVVMRG